MTGQPRTYRQSIDRERRSFFRVTVKETDLFIHAPECGPDAVRRSILEHRGRIERYIEQQPEFARSLTPWRLSGPAPNIIRDMCEAGQAAGVGPMAAVAGVMSEYVGRDLLELSSAKLSSVKISPEVIVENGGDIFLRIDTPVHIAVYAADSPLSMKIGIRMKGGPCPKAICTSSGTVGHSLSMGKADAVCVAGDSCPLADAAATAVGNRVNTASDISSAIEFAGTIPGVKGVLVIAGDKMGAWGDIELTPLHGKKL